MYNQKLTKDQFAINRTNKEEQNAAFDLALENVINWSTVKDVHSLEVPYFQRNNVRSRAGELIKIFKCHYPKYCFI